MEDQKTAAKRQAIEAEGIDAAKQAINVAPKIAEVKRSRFDRRLENRKKEILDKLVLKYFKERSSFADPDGMESACAFDKYEMEWRWECKTFNRGRHPMKLRYEAFSESVTFYLDMEKKQILKSFVENKINGFQHWLRRARVWRTRPLTSLYFWLKALGNKANWLDYWKQYYLTLKI